MDDLGCLGGDLLLLGKSYLAYLPIIKIIIFYHHYYDGFTAAISCFMVGI